MKLKKLLIAVLALSLCIFSSCAKQPSSSSSEYEDAVTYKGEKYVLKDNIETILLIGIDKYSDDVTYEGYRNNYQSDFLFLVVVDKDMGECKGLFLNRDTMVNVRVLGVSGSEAGYRFEQLALSHTYGSGGSDSAINTVTAVSDLLYGIPINYFVQATMDIVPAVNDYVGGVTVQVLDDLTFVDPQLAKGETVTRTYVRRRFNVEDSTNLHRMERQRQFIENLLKTISLKESKNSDYTTEMLADLIGQVETNCSVNKLNELIELIGDQEDIQILTIDGENELGQRTETHPEFMEYYIDEDSLKDVYFELFYIKAD